MSKVDVFRVEGFAELNQKLKRLDDQVKRKEVLAIQRRLAKPIVKVYAEQLPKRSGTLSKSVAVKTVSIRRSDGNPTIEVLPGKRGRYDGYYRFMVIPKGTATGSRRRGSRKGINTVVPDARDRTLAAVAGQVSREAEEKTARYIQKKINRI